MIRLRDFLTIGAVAVAALLAVGCGHDAQHPETSVSASSARIFGIHRIWFLWSRSSRTKKPAARS